MTAAAALLGVCGWAGAQGEASGAARVAFDIDASSMVKALIQFTEQSGLQLAFPTEGAHALPAPRVVGRLTPREALEQLLKGSGLQYEFTNDRTVSVRPRVLREEKTSAAARARAAMRFARAQPDHAAAAREGIQSGSRQPMRAGQTDSSDEEGTPEILVEGKRTLNVDIRRSEDAPQPYVVFDSTEIERSQAVNLNEFLRTRLPMNTASRSLAQAPGSANTTSSIDLRGLGSEQTLILVDGRRMPGLASSGTPSQPDLNGIPLAAIERIEVLPSTASGIYGGSATGGVVNIILRRDFSGVELKADYANTFDADAAAVRLDGTAGFTLQGGRTQIMLTASYSEANRLVIGDRDFASRALALQLRNNPAAVIDSGFPPYGAAVNILSSSLDLNFMPELLTLDDEYGGTSLNALITHIPLGYAGPDSDNGAGLMANAGQYNLDIPEGLLGKQRSLLAAPTMESATFNVRHQLGERFEMFIDLSTLGNRGGSFDAFSPPSYAVMDADAPTNPFQQNIYVTFPAPDLSFESSFKSTTVRATGGLIARLPGGWTGELDYNWSRSRSKTVGTSSVIDNAGQTALDTGLPSADGRPALNALQEGNTFPVDFTPYLLPIPGDIAGPFDTLLKDATLRASGSVMSLPGGELRVSTLIEYREEALQDAFFEYADTFTGMRTPAFYPERSQTVNSYYLEANAPLARALELQASVRRDEYKTRSDGNSGYTLMPPDYTLPTFEYSTSEHQSTDYTLGLRYSPLQGLTLRASYGTGFLPPSVTQVAAQQRTIFFTFVGDPLRGNTPVASGRPLTMISGGSPGLQPEESASWSAGLILSPTFLPGLRLSVDYTKIDKTDEIQVPNVSFVLANADAFPGRVVRGENLPTDDENWAGPVTLLDISLLNLARTSVQAYDIQLDYMLGTQRIGDWRWYVMGTRQTHFQYQTLPGSPLVNSVGYSDGPLKWRGNFGFVWDRGPLSLAWNAQHYDEYRVSRAGALPALDTLNQGSASIPSQIYHDLIATWRIGETGGGFGGLFSDSSISVGIQNLFNESPPILASISTVAAGYSTYGDPRLRRYSVTLRKSFW